MLILCLLAGSMPAFALTGEEALGLVDVGTDRESGSVLTATYPTLQLGSRDGVDAGAYVIMLQNRLAQLGYLASAADGQFGSMTESALIAFQENNGLTPTGIADDSTQMVLYSVNAVQAPAEVVADNNVVYVQKLLLQYGFMTGKADGVAGDGTRMGVAEFKNYIHNTCRSTYAAYATATPAPAATLAPGEMPLPVDISMASMINMVNGQDGEITDDVVKFAMGEYTFQPYQYTVQSGSEGAEVWRVQRRLKQLNYLYGPDGNFGGLSELAIKYFQKKNGLPETGVADQATQTALFSETAVPAEEYVFPYKIGVSIDKQRVYIYGWDGSGYNKELKAFKCSTGMAGYDTPVGTYQSGGKMTSGEWYYFTDYNCYAKYAYKICGGIFFHSVLFNARKQGPTNSSVNALGRKASHGCIRLAVDNAKWIFENCPIGTTIVVR